jgi:hypothetical protein
MSQKKTNNYPSKYSNGKFVSAAQYITEIICERKAFKEKKDLCYRFWTNKDWASFYRNQIGSAHKLLKTYPDKAIIRALTSTYGQKIYSLRAPHLPSMIEKEAAMLSKENQKLTSRLSRIDNVTFGNNQSNNSKKNILSKLKELDNES